MNKYMLIDMNSIGHAAHNGTTLSIQGREVQAIFGVLRTVRSLMVQFPGERVIALWDGRAQWRWDLYPGYKDRTGKDAASDLRRENYTAQINEIKIGLQLLGIPQLTPYHAEADDLAAQLSRLYSARGDKVRLISGDKDWMQLIDENVCWHEHRQENKRTVTLAGFFEETGYSTTEQFICGKALQGDSSDTIKGVGGIGEKTAIDFIARYGSVDNFLKKFEAGDIAKPGKVLTTFAKNEVPTRKGYEEPMMDVYHRNMKLMDLGQAPSINKSEIETIHGKLDEVQFMEFAGGLVFNSITHNFNDWINPFRRAA